MSNGVENEFGTVDFNFDGPRKTFPKHWKLKSPENGQEEFTIVQRILPPMKSLKDNARGYAHFDAVHYGYNGVNQKNKEQVRYRPFRCVRDVDYNTKEVLVECDACLAIEQKKALKESLLEKAKKDKLTPTQTETLLGPINEWITSHNRDSKFRLNVMSPNEEFGVLVLTKTCFKEELNPKFKKLAKEEGIHPLAPDQGVWVKFTRTGSFRDVVDRVEFVTESVALGNGKTAKSIKTAPLTEAQLKKALEICPDLSMAVDVLTPNQIKAVVNASSPEEVDSIWDRKSATSQEPTEDQEAQANAPSASMGKSADDFFDKFKEEFNGNGQ